MIYFVKLTVFSYFAYIYPIFLNLILLNNIFITFGKKRVKFVRKLLLIYFDCHSLFLASTCAF